MCWTIFLVEKSEHQPVVRTIPMNRPEQKQRVDTVTIQMLGNTQPVTRAIGVSHTACKDGFRQNIQSHSWSVFLFL